MWLIVVVGVLLGCILFGNDSLLASRMVGIKGNFPLHITILENFGLERYLSACIT